ncbi:MAG: response regulator [Aliidongia sp.]
MINPAVARRSKIIMVVDDAWENLLHIQNLVESHGYVCIAVPSGQDCLELVNRAPPRVIVLDIEMPEMNGFETCRRLRRLPAMRRVPIMFLTACKTAEAVRTGIGVGGNDFVVKPFDPAKLLERIDHWASTQLAG